MTTTTTINTTFRAADYDRYVAIEDLAFSMMADEIECDFDAVVAFAATLGVLFTEWDWISLGIDFDEM